METIKEPIVVFWLCMLLHLIADYTMQGVLASLKQRKWWSEELKKLAYSTKEPKTPEEQELIFSHYRYDYLAGLACHAMMWSIMMCLPLLLVCTPSAFSAAVVTNTVVHMVVDDLKANLCCINLWQDQLLHIAQITVTVGILAY